MQLDDDNRELLRLASPCDSGEPLRDNPRQEKHSSCVERQPRHSARKAMRKKKKKKKKEKHQSITVELAYGRCVTDYTGTTCG